MRKLSINTNTFPGIGLLCLALSAVPSLANAGGGHGESSSQAHGNTVIGKPGVATDATQTIEVLMGDNYYELDSIPVSPGETVRFVVKNNGSLVHEFNIGTPVSHAGHQAEMLTMAQHGIIQGNKINREMMKMDMGGGKTMEHNDPNSVLLAPGEQAEIVWSFPGGGELEFACNLPGHYQSGMTGGFNFSS